MTLSRRMVYLEQLFAGTQVTALIDDTLTATDKLWSSQRIADEFGYYAKIDTSVSFSDLTVNGRNVLADIDGKAPTVHTHEITQVNGLQLALDAKIDLTKIGAANGVASLDADGFVPASQLHIGDPNGIAGLDSNGLVPASQLPSFVDDVLEYADLASFPVLGESGKIYVAKNAGTAADPSKTYRWGGSAYVEISGSPGSTDAVPEGSVNLYFTNARAVAALNSTLAGYAALAGATFTGAITAPTVNGIAIVVRGTTNIGIGLSTIPAGATGTYNIAVGDNAASLLTTGSQNCFFGRQAGGRITTGSNSLSIGYQALFLETTGSSNTALGSMTLRNQATANQNTGLGVMAGYEVTTGSNNTLVGYSAGRGITTGSNNTIIGANVTGLAVGLANNIILADGAGNIKYRWDGTKTTLTGDVSVSGALTVAGKAVQSQSSILDALAALTIAGNANMVIKVNASADGFVLAADATGGAGGGGLVDQDYGDVLVQNSGTQMVVQSAAGAFDAAGTIRATSRLNPTSGAGLEFLYDAAGGTGNLGAGNIFSYDRSTFNYRDLVIGASKISLRWGSTDVLTIGNGTADFIGALTATRNDGAGFAATITHNGGTVARSGLKITTSGTSGNTEAFRVDTGSVSGAFIITGDGAIAANAGIAVTGGVTTQGANAGVNFAQRATGNNFVVYADAGRLNFYSNSAVRGFITDTGNMTLNGTTLTVGGVELVAAIAGKIASTEKGAINGVATLDATGKVPAAQLPSFVDDVIEAASFAALPATGEAGKIYVTTDTTPNKSWRWSGTQYVAIASSPGTTDDVVEGSVNKYYTDVRVRACVATGLVDTAGTPSAADSILTILGKIRKGFFTDHASQGGSVHANAVANGAAGFMTGADKAKLDGLGTASTLDIAVGTTAPANPAVNALWVDTN